MLKKKCRAGQDFVHRVMIGSLDHVSDMDAGGQGLKLVQLLSKLIAGVHVIGGTLMFVIKY